VGTLFLLMSGARVRAGLVNLRRGWLLFGGCRMDRPCASSVQHLQSGNRYRLCARRSHRQMDRTRPAIRCRPS